MSTLADLGAPPGGGGAEPRDDPGLWPVVLGALAALQAAAVSFVAAGVPVVLAWAAAPGERAPAATAARFAADLWLLAHGATIGTAGGAIGIVPLGLLAAPLLTCWFAGARLARALDPRADAVRSGIGRVTPATPPARAVAALALTYAAVAAGTALLARSADASPSVPAAFTGGGLVALAGAVPGVAAWRGRGARAGLGVLARAGGVPPILRDWARPAAGAISALLAASAVLTVAAAGVGAARIGDIHSALAPGLAGGTALVAGQLLVVPDAVVWAAAWLAGPGFAVGTGTSVDPGGTVLGPLPALPLFGALPVPGTNPAWLWAVLAVPVAAGAVGGRMIARQAPRAPVTQWLVDAAGTGLVAGAALGVLAALANGPAGPGRMAHLGPDPWWTALATAGETGAGALLAVTTAAAIRHWKAAKGR